MKEGVLTVNSAGIGAPSRELLRKRACELAVLDGRSAQEVSKSDWEQAKRELSGQSDADPKETAIESAPESERWDPVPGSAGQKARVSPSEDEDDEGRSDNEQLTEEGVAEAERDQTLQAAKLAAKKDQ